MKFGKQSDQVPTEVQEYYNEQSRSNQGKAWLLAIGTLLITLAVALGLFFAGRFVYRAITDSGDRQPEPAVTQSPTEVSESEGQTSSTSTSEPSSSTTTPTTATQATPSTTTLPSTAGEAVGAER